MKSEWDRIKEQVNQPKTKEAEEASERFYTLLKEMLEEAESKQTPS